MVLCLFVSAQEEICMFRSISLLGVAALLSLIFISTSHAAITGLIVKDTGVPIASVDGVTVTGELSVGEAETSPILEIFWVDDILGEIQPSGSGDSLGWTIGDVSLVVLNRLTTWTFNVESVGEHGPTTIVFRLYVAGALEYTSQEIPLHVESPHAEPEGLVIRSNNIDLLTLWEGVVTGQLNVMFNDSTDFDVYFLDADSAEFQPDEEDFWLQVPVADPATAVADTTSRWNFLVHGLLAGSTTLDVEVWHIDHADYISQPLPVKVLNRGDANSSGGLSISDAVFVIAYIFGGGAAPQPLLAGDADCSGIITISDAVFLIAHIFGGGPAPAC